MPVENQDQDLRRFSWEDLGDVETGRPNLGPSAPVAVYRLLQFTLREAVASRYGAEAAREVLREAGLIAGREFCRQLLDVSLAHGPFLGELQRTLREWELGVLRVEQSDPGRQEFVLTIAEDLDCSGLPVSDRTVCEFDEGFIAGIFHEYTGRDFVVREVDCWASGDRVCRFVARPKGDGHGG
jgi:predicted hydrocarbon binding protein